MNGRKAFRSFVYQGRDIMIEAHRGNRGSCPENTLIAFAEALKAGAGQIEFDIRAAKDGTVFVFHDATIDRTTDGTGPLSSLRREEVKELDAGSWFSPVFAGERVPTLGETLDFLKGRARLNIEVKTTDTSDELWKTAVSGAIEEINRREMWEDVVFSSFSVDALRYVKQSKPSAALGLLDWDFARRLNNKQVLLALGGKYWLLHTSLLTAAEVEEAHRQGLEVFSGVGDGESLQSSIQRVLDLGVDVLATDHPDRVCKELQGLLS